MARRNAEAVEAGRESGVIELCTDYNETYRHTLMYENVYFFTQFRACYGVPQDCAILLRGEHYAPYPITLDGAPFSPPNPSTRYAYSHGGVLYLPFEEVAAAAGAQLSWAPGVEYTIVLDGQTYHFRQGNGYITAADGSIAQAGCLPLTVTDRTYLALDAACAFLGLTADFDGVTVALTAKENP